MIKNKLIRCLNVLFVLAAFVTGSVFPQQFSFSDTTLTWDEFVQLVPDQDLQTIAVLALKKLFAAYNANDVNSCMKLISPNYKDDRGMNFSDMPQSIKSDHDFTTDDPNKIKIIGIDSIIIERGNPIKVTIRARWNRTVEDRETPTVIKSQDETAFVFEISAPDQMVPRTACAGKHFFSFLSEAYADETNTPQNQTSGSSSADTPAKPQDSQKDFEKSKSGEKTTYTNLKFKGKSPKQIGKILTENGNESVVQTITVTTTRIVVRLVDKNGQEITRKYENLALTVSPIPGLTTQSMTGNELIKFIDQRSSTAPQPAVTPEPKKKEEKTKQEEVEVQKKITKIVNENTSAVTTPLPPTGPTPPPPPKQEGMDEADIAKASNAALAEEGEFNKAILGQRYLNVRLVNQIDQHLYGGPGNTAAIGGTTTNVAGLPYWLIYGTAVNAITGQNIAVNRTYKLSTAARYSNLVSQITTLQIAAGALQSIILNNNGAVSVVPATPTGEVMGAAVSAALLRLFVLTSNNARGNSAKIIKGLGTRASFSDQGSPANPAGDFLSPGDSYRVIINQGVARATMFLLTVLTIDARSKIALVQAQTTSAPDNG